MDKLKPCPFCGKEPTLYQDEMTGHWAVRCVKDTHRPTLINSHGATAWCYSCTDPAAAIEAWNTRANDTLAAENDVTASGDGVITRTCHKERTCSLELEEPKEDGVWWCSRCKSYHQHKSKYPWRYCPRCGAKVVSE